MNETDNNDGVSCGPANAIRNAERRLTIRGLWRWIGRLSHAPGIYVMVLVHAPRLQRYGAEPQDHGWRPRHLSAGKPTCRETLNYL